MNIREPLPSLNQEDDIALGLDIGKTKVAAGLVSRTGQLLTFQSVVSTAAAGSEALLQTCRELITAVLKISPRRPIGIGVGAPGVVDLQRGVVLRSEVIHGWINVPLGEIFQAEFELPAIADNDVYVGARGEARFGAARSISSAVYMVIGTGIGVATIHHGEVRYGAHYLAGQIAHLMLPGMGRTLQETFSGHGLEVQAANKLGTSYSTSDVFDLAKAGDQRARELVDEAVDCAALTLAWLQQVVDPEIFVLSGGVALGEETLISSLKRRIDEYLRPYKVRVPALEIIQSPLGATGGVLGAASLVFDAQDTASASEVQRSGQLQSNCQRDKYV